LPAVLVPAFALPGRLGDAVAPACERPFAGRFAAAALWPAALDVLAAALRGLVRPGRVRGRFPSTLSRSAGELG
jgi:hypothetical protein